MNPELSQYLELRSRVDEKFREIETKFAAEMKCRAGCHSCCKPGLTVSELEAAALREFLDRSPAAVALAREAKSRNPHRGKRCSLLSAEGQCAVYEARPLVCRSHGVPLQVSEAEDRKVRDVCPLNFTSMPLHEVPAESVLNMDTLNVLLSLLNQRAFGKSTRRIALDIDALLSR